MGFPKLTIRDGAGILSSEVFDSDGTVAIMMGNGLDILHIGPLDEDGNFEVRVFPSGEAESVVVTVQGPR